MRSLFVLAATLTGCVQLDGGRLAAVAGYRTLAEDEFGELDSPELFGAEIVVSPAEFPLDLEFGVYHHREDGVLPATGNTEINGTELAVGPRIEFPLTTVPMRAYVALGASLFYTDRSNQMMPIVGTSGSDFDTGFYGRAGIVWLLREHFVLGVDARWIQESQFDYGGYDLDGAALTVHLGWSF